MKGYKVGGLQLGSRVVVVVPVGKECGACRSCRSQCSDRIPHHTLAGRWQVWGVVSVNVGGVAEVGVLGEGVPLAGLLEEYKDVSSPRCVGPDPPDTLSVPLRTPCAVSL